MFSRKDPEELVENSQARPGVLALQNGELLPKSQVFEPKAPTRTEKPDKRG